jgi:hypothetical protein
VIKVYGTLTPLPYEMLCKMREMGFPREHHNQFRIICKAKSMAEANRLCETAGVGRQVFISAYTSATGNDKELAYCENHVIGISDRGTHTGNYVTPAELL